MEPFGLFMVKAGPCRFDGTPWSLLRDLSQVSRQESRQCTPNTLDRLSLKELLSVDFKRFQGMQTCLFDTQRGSWCYAIGSFTENITVDFLISCVKETLARMQPEFAVFVPLLLVMLLCKHDVCGGRQDESRQLRAREWRNHSALKNHMSSRGQPDCLSSVKNLQ